MLNRILHTKDIPRNKSVRALLSIRFSLFCVGVFFVMEQQLWKDIPGYESLYKINTEGVVKSKPKWYKGRFFDERIISTTTHKRSGYVRLQLNKPGFPHKSFGIHKLVALTFLIKLDVKSVVNHKNGIKSDNRLENLEWCTSSYNTQHAYDNGLKKKGAEHCMARIVLNTHNGVFHGTVGEAADTYGINHNTLYNKLSGKRRNNTQLIFA